MQEIAGIRVMRPVGTFCQPAYHRARVAMPHTIVANPIPDHGGTSLSEKLNSSGINEIYCPDMSRAT